MQEFVVLARQRGYEKELTKAYNSRSVPLPPFSHGHLSTFEDVPRRLKDAGLYLAEGVVQAVRQALEKRQPYPKS